MSLVLPNLKHLHYLVILHQYQHFNRAAQACFISQSTLSSAILKLEEQLNCQLIERDHKAFIFTAQGDQVVLMAQQLINNAADLVSYGQAQGEVEQGSITIGCIPTIAPYLLQDLARAAQASLPNLTLYFVEATTDNLLAQLQQGKIDFALLALPIKNHAFKAKKLGIDNFYIAGNKNLVERFKAAYDYQSLPEHSVFLLTQENCITEHALSACKLADPSKIHQFSASSLPTLVQMTAFHQGFTFLPEMAVKKGLGKEQDLVIEKLGDDVFREIGMLWRPTSMRQQSYLRVGEVIERILNNSDKG
ncbi:MAG: hydrogen peroxide-inducible genes activator [Thalassotalea sp.]